MLPVYQESKPACRGRINKNIVNNEKELSTYQPSLPQEGFFHTFLPTCGARKATSEIRQSAGRVQPEQWGKTINRYSKLNQIRVKQNSARI